MGIDFLFIPPRFLIEKGIDVSIKDDDGNTALHIALKEAIKTRSSSEVNEGIHNSEFSHVIYPCSFVHQCITRPMLLLFFFFLIMITGDQSMVSIDDSDVKSNFQNLAHRKLQTNCPMVCMTHSGVLESLLFLCSFKFAKNNGN